MEPILTEASDLLQRARHVRRLVRALVRNASDAEDVEQQVWLAAVERPPQAGNTWQWWVAGVVRNWKRKLLREHGRRQRRERMAARAEAQPSALETNAQLEAMQGVLAAVHGLAEPLRTTITLRFLDGLPPRLVARRMGVPVATVRSRVRRGLELLREELGRRHRGEEAGWLAAVAPLLGPETGRILTGGMLMGVKAKVSAALLVGACVLGWWLWSAPAPSAAGADTHGMPEPALAAAATQPDGPGSPAAHAPREQVTVPAQWVLRGRAALEMSDEPVPAVRVRAELFEGYEPQGAPSLAADLLTDAHGGFSWSLAAPRGAVVLRARGMAAGYLSRALDVLVPPAEPPPQDLEVAFWRLDARVLGTVTGADATPLAGARVKLAYHDVEARTDADGRYALAVPSAFRTLRLVVAAAGHAVQEAQCDARPGQDLRMDIRLRKAAVVRGQVRDEQRVPIAGATVTSFGAFEFPAIADATGQFELACLDPEGRVSGDLMVRADGFVGQFVRLQLGTEPQTHVVTLVRGVCVQGTVVDERGAGIAGVRVDSRLVNGVGVVAPTAVTRDDGGFVLTGRAIGRQRLLVQRGGYAPRLQEVDLPEAGRDDLRLVLERGASLRGTVTDPGGAPLGGVAVVFRSEYGDSLEGRLKTDARGGFVVMGLPPEGSTLVLSKRGLVQFTERLQGTEPERRYVLTPCGGFAGQVLDADTGEPIARFRIRLVRAELLPGESHAGGFAADWMAGHWIESHDGRWATTSRDTLTVGTVLGVEASAPDYSPCVQAHVAVSATPNAEPLVLRLSHGAQVRDRVVLAADESPAAGATVRLLRHGGRPESAQEREATRDQSTAQTDTHGAFTIDHVPSGEARLRIEHPDWPVHEDGPFLVPGAGATERLVALPPGGTLTGRVLDIAGAAVPGAEVSLRAWRDPEGRPGTRTARADAEGSFRCERLRPGDYTVAHVTHHGAVEVTRFSTRVTVTDGPTRFDLDPRRGTAALRLQITRAGRPAEATSVSLTQWAFGKDLQPLPQHHCTWGGLVEHGTCELRGLLPGEYMVGIGSPMGRRVEVSAGTTVELTIQLPE